MNCRRTTAWRGMTAFTLLPRAHTETGLLKLTKRMNFLTLRVVWQIGLEISLWRSYKDQCSFKCNGFTGSFLKLGDGRFSISFLPRPRWWMMSTGDTLLGACKYFTQHPASYWQLYFSPSSQESIRENKEEPCYDQNNLKSSFFFKKKR